MARYRNRVVDRLVTDALETFGAVILEGPRAVGKTTTGQFHAASSVRLEASEQWRSLAELSPAAVLAGDSPRLIDEWQLAPTLWNAVRHEVDVRGAPGQFILTGSALPTDDTARHSGAGRFRRITLRPMSLAESGDSASLVDFRCLMERGNVAGVGGPSIEQYAQLVIRGGWPALISSPTRSPRSYLSAYLDDVARIDLADMGLRVDPIRMRALIRALSRNVSTAAALAVLARESEVGAAGLSKPGSSKPGSSSQTVRRYIDALTRVFVVEELAAWAPHLRSKVRLRVQPTWHFSDPSIAAAALEASPRVLLADLSAFGMFFESLCVRDLRIYAQVLDGSVYHYRDETGLEVDAIVELSGGGWGAFEVKLGGAQAIDNAAANLKKLAAKVSQARASALRVLVVLTGGNASYVRPDGVRVVSIGQLFV